MFKPLNIVLQGPLDNYAVEVANSYLECDFVPRVIISCWENDPDIPCDDRRIVIVRNQDVANPSIGNRNRQIYSSQQGLKHVQTDICVKLRTDQRISMSSLHMMYEFFEKFYASPIRYVDNTGPKGRIFVTSLFSRYPFHPRDHVFWGFTSDLIAMFDIPLCPLLPFPVSDDSQYVLHTRAETYICSFYYARFDDEIKTFIQSPNEYLIDGAPKLQQAMEKYHKFDESVFKTFPPIQMEWPKRGLKFYPYYGHNPHGEVWDERPWRQMK